MGTVNTVSFPGLGINELKLPEVAFNLFGRNVAWYGIIITCGIIVAFFYALYRAKQEGISTDDMLDYAIFTVVPGIIGARAYYVIMDGIENYPTFLDMIAVWNGGLAIYGGIIAGVIAILIVSKVKKINFFKVTDAIAPGVMIAQAIGRWGNFFNAEAYGSETTLPWRMGLTEFSGTKYVHPTFLYESLWNVLGFVLINIFYKKKKFNGEIFIAYVTWYGFGRMLIESLRTDSLMLGSFRVSQLVGFFCFIVGLILIIVLRILAFSHKLPKIFAKSSKSNETVTDEEKEKTESKDQSADSSDKTEKNKKEEFEKWQI